MFNLIVLLLIQSTWVKCQTGQNTRLDVPANITNQISFQFYWGDTVYDYKTISYESGMSILNQTSYNINKKTVFYMPGWSERPSEHRSYESIDTIVRAFQFIKSVNLVVINYQNLVDGNFDIFQSSTYLQNQNLLKSVDNAPMIGKALANFFRSFIPACRCGETKLHIIGFSLGAQLMHYIAKNLDFKLQRMTALDAAGGKYMQPGHEYLTRNDSVFLDAIHTSAGGVGFQYSFATADFYPNQNATVQPRCKPRLFSVNRNNESSVHCNHYMAVRYYAESIIYPWAFPSKHKRPFGLFFDAKTIRYQDEVAFMGYGVQTTSVGDYYGGTGNTPPYGNQPHGGSWLPWMMPVPPMMNFG